MARGDAQGFGLGLRPIYYPDIVDRLPPVDWFEITSENFMVPGGRPLAILDSIRTDYPLRLHGTSLSIGSVDPLDLDYLQALKRLIARAQPELVSDHLAWTGVQGVNLHGLLPIPYTSEALTHCVERISIAQEFLGRRLAFENIASHVGFAASEMSEAEFLTEVAERADCLLLLDVNNAFISSRNLDFDAYAFLDALPRHRVAQIHVGGHSDRGAFKIDTHDQPISDEVWALYGHARRRFGPVPAMIERNDHFPPFADLLDDLEHLRFVAAQALREVA
jgi:uncharacterized protein (UPF0276 family)